MKVQLIHSFLNFAQNISECLTVVGTSFQGTHFNVNLLYTAQQVINLQHTNTVVWKKLFIGKEELERKSTGRWWQWATQQKARKVSKPKWGGSHGNLAMSEDPHIDRICYPEVTDRRSRDLPERKLWSQLQFMRWVEKNSATKHHCNHN